MKEPLEEHYRRDPLVLWDHLAIFDIQCKSWTSDPYTNKSYLIDLQRFYNDLFRKRGYVFLYEILDDIGYDYGELNTVWGWYYDPESPIYGSNEVSFGIFNLYQRKNREFVNELNPNVILNFNCDCDLTDLYLDFDRRKRFEEI